MENFIWHKIENALLNTKERQLPQKCENNSRTNVLMFNVIINTVLLYWIDINEICNSVNIQLDCLKLMIKKVHFTIPTLWKYIHKSLNSLI